jgi:hypothetical protein
MALDSGIGIDTPIPSISYKIVWSFWAWEHLFLASCSLMIGFDGILVA